MENSGKVGIWISLLSKLIWPVFIVILLVIYSKSIGEAYDVVLESIKSGRSMKIGILELGQAADKTEIRSFPYEEMSTIVIEGPAGFVEEAEIENLNKIKQELEENPSRTIDTLMVKDKVIHTSDRLKRAIAKFGLRYVVFEKNGKFDGWILSSNFVAQLPPGSVSYDELKKSIVGIRNQTVSPDDSMKKVLGTMLDLHTDSLPVVDSGGKWKSFANRGEILGRLTTEIILQDVE